MKIRRSAHGPAQVVTVTEDLNAVDTARSVSRAAAKLLAEKATHVAQDLRQRAERIDDRKLRASATR